MIGWKVEQMPGFKLLFIISVQLIISVGLLNSSLLFIKVV
jgi:hypothetical protein